MLTKGSLSQKIVESTYQTETNQYYKRGKTIGNSVGAGIGAGIAAGIGSVAVQFDGKTKGYLTAFKAAAEGGIFEAGELFIAREAGPEMVGTIGNKTAVANTQQIVTGIADGVYEANTEQNILLEKIYEALVTVANNQGKSNQGGTGVSDITRMNRRVGSTVIPIAT